MWTGSNLGLIRFLSGDSKKLVGIFQKQGIE